MTDDGRTRKRHGSLDLPASPDAAQTLNDRLNLTPSRLGMPLPS